MSEQKIEEVPEWSEMTDEKKKDLEEQINKYNTWLADNGVNDKTRGEFTTSVSKEKVILYRQVSVFEIIQPESVE